MNQTENIRQSVKSFVLEEFLPGEDANELQDSTPLVSGGILDSLATIKLVNFLESTYQITFEPHEISAEHLDTLPTIAGTVVRKQAGLK